MTKCEKHGTELVLFYKAKDIDFPLSREDEELPIKQMTFEISEVCKSCFEEKIK